MAVSLVLGFGFSPQIYADILEPSGLVVTEELPTAPWHDYVTETHLSTPPGQRNPCVDWLDTRLGAAIEGRLHTLWPREEWLDAAEFLNWAVWGFLSPDSHYYRDERIIPLIKVWLEYHLQNTNTRNGNERPGRLDKVSFHSFSIPLIDILANPALADKIGQALVARWKTRVIANIQQYTQPAVWDKTLSEAKQSINLATHSMAIYIHGWLLTSDTTYLRMAATLVTLLARDQLPNGTFRYRTLGDGHLEPESMYYHGINVRALYLYWWHTHSRLAESLLTRSSAYYPLRMEPPYYVEDNSSVWWKDQWRTFWPQHIAMVAAVSKDGENATIAWTMARDNVSADRIDLVLGAHAFQRMALRKVIPAPRRDQYIIADPDIGGLRGRFGRFGFNFSTNSYGHTIAGVMAVSPDQRHWAALHLARPYIRVEDTNGERTRFDYSSVGRIEPPSWMVIDNTIAVAATAFTPFDRATTWKSHHRMAPWQSFQLWFYTPDSVVGFMRTVASEENQAREVAHQFRFSLPKGKILAPGERAFDGGLLWLKVHATNLPQRFVERAPRNVLEPDKLSDWQIVLSDTERPMHKVLQSSDNFSTTKPLRSYSKGHSVYSLVEIGTTGRNGAKVVTSQQTSRFDRLTVVQDDKTFIALFIHGDTLEPIDVPIGRQEGSRIECRYDTGDGVSHESTLYVHNKRVSLTRPKPGLYLFD